MLIKIFKEQNGLCFYSGIPLKFGNSKIDSWIISLERIDVFKGYVEDNICLICNEFNSGDRSICYKDNTTGNCGWNKDKFQFFLKNIKEKIKNI